MKVELLSHSPNPEKVIACASKLCYSNSSIDDLYDGLTEEASANFVEKLASFGHASPIEHVSFTFGIEGVSRTLLAQITRHRIASFSVQSQRYVKLDQFEYITPPEIEKNPKAKAVFIDMMEKDLKAYIELCDILSKSHYEEFIKKGIPEKKAASMAEKKANEDARFVLPNACETKMIITMNARSLMNFFAHRCCDRAQWEIKELADEMLKIVYKIAPTLFVSAGPPCYKKSCPEGAMSCGKMTYMKEFYSNLYTNATSNA